ncbi:MAG: hypothetical protein MI976_11520 [Pseudomonadales bacterium]|nr:hypothetical protein [Pseudomonadales bacterium]
MSDALDQQAKLLAKETTADSRLSLPSWVIIMAVLVGLTVFHGVLHWHMHQVVSLHQMVLTAFLVLNLLVNFWELGLYFTGDQIRQEYLDNKDNYVGRPTAPAMLMFLRRVPLSRVFSFKQWTGIWSSYCYFDSGYSRRGSFGYNIDVGNGFSTILPATLFTLSMTFDWLSARIVGIIGIAMFWQMFYGTVVYFFQFFNAGRHKGHTSRDLWLFVGSSNGMWFIFPIWGLLASVWMIYTDSYELFTDPAVTSIWSVF